LLLHKDAELTEARVGQVIRGMELSMQATGATEGIFPIKALMQKLGVKGYDVPAPWVEIDYAAKRVTLPLSQHVGAPAEAVVKPGDKITLGQVVADIPEGKLAARIHASIDGSVTAVNGAIIIEQS
jgi:biotin carboxyl carrier protein